MKNLSKEKFIASLEGSFRKMNLELDSLPPVLFNDKKIKAHVGDKPIDACELVAHAIGWTELGIKWMQTIEISARPDLSKICYTWDELDQLALDFYSKYNRRTFKELQMQLLDCKNKLVELIDEANEELIFKNTFSEDRSIAQLVYSRISSLYQSDLIRLRTWKKGLGWI